MVASGQRMTSAATATCTRQTGTAGASSPGRHLSLRRRCNRPGWDMPSGQHHCESPARPRRVPRPPPPAAVPPGRPSAAQTNYSAGCPQLLCRQLCRRLRRPPHAPPPQQQRRPCRRGSDDAAPRRALQQPLARCLRQPPTVGRNQAQSAPAPEAAGSPAAAAVPAAAAAACSHSARQSVDAQAATCTPHRAQLGISPTAMTVAARTGAAAPAADVTVAAGPGFDQPLLTRRQAWAVGRSKPRTIRGVRRPRSRMSACVTACESSAGSTLPGRPYILRQRPRQ
eukprot:360082-Chlamydomonas_euryale.AAC.6